MALYSGAMVADRYRLTRLIATGGMGQVWEGLDTRLDRRVAVKVLKAELSHDQDFLTRFRFEARTTAQLNHPGIAGVFDYGETTDEEGQSVAYLVMELVHGEPLNAVLSRVGRLSLTQALDMLEQTGRALQAAHNAGVVHRDVKPGNILITPTGQVKITDYGIAKAVDASPVTRTGMVMGTAQYIAPEQALGQEATSASDVYSLGAVGYEVLSGRRPFLGESVVTVAMKHVQETPAPMPADLPHEVHDLIDIAMTKDPKYRYSSGGEFADAVAAVRSGRPAPPPGNVPPVTSANRVLPPGVPGATTTVPMQSGKPQTQQYAPTAYTQAPYTGASQPPTSGPPPYGAAAAASPGGDDNRKMPSPTALAWAAGIAIVLAVVTLFIVLTSNDKDEPETGQSPTTQITTTTQRPTTTTRAPQTTTSEWTAPLPVPTEPPTFEPTTTVEVPTTVQPTTTVEVPTPTTQTPTTTTATPTTTATATTTQPVEGGEESPGDASGGGEGDGGTGGDEEPAASNGTNNAPPDTQGTS
jgi:serine/threonine-protein kinase